MLSVPPGVRLPRPHRTQIEHLQLTTKSSSWEPVTFSIFSCFLHSNQLYFKPPNKAVILSEALRRSVANSGLYSAESKDPGGASWPMPLVAFQPLKPAPGGPATAFPRTENSANRRKNPVFSFSGLGG